MTAKKDSLMDLFFNIEFGSIITVQDLCFRLHGGKTEASIKKIERELVKLNLLQPLIEIDTLEDEDNRLGKKLVINSIIADARKKRQLVVFAKLIEVQGHLFFFHHDALGSRRWQRIESEEIVVIEQIFKKISSNAGKAVVLIPTGRLTSICRVIARKHGIYLNNCAHPFRVSIDAYHLSPSEIICNDQSTPRRNSSIGLTHLDKLEAESIHIFREVMAESDNPVMLYSVGKDSSVMLHLARKAFYPSPPPFPLLHVDTRWKFKAMYDFRDYMARASGMDLLVHINPDGVEKNINPFDHGSALHTDIMKTEGLKQALDHYKFDVAFGGARRDEEKSRAKERVFSFRTASHRWDPKNQRPELWNLYNGKKNSDESIRVFPISNWTELDIWQYIYREQIPIVPLYFATERPVIERDGMLMMVDDDRLPLHPNEKIQLKKIRFRTLGCYPLTGAIESEADDVASIVLELLSARTSERQGRAIDTDSNASMEKKKQEGYF